MDLSSFEKTKKEYARTKVEVAVEESFVHPSPFLTPEIISKRVNFQTDEELNFLYVKFKKGIEIFVQEVTTLPEETQKSILSSLSRALLGRSEELKLEKTSELSNEEVVLLHQLVKKIFADGRLEDASDCFLVLTQVAPGAEQIWLEFGIVKQKQRHFDDALILYAQSSYLNTSHPVPHLYIADCCAEQGRSEEAIQALDRAVILIEKDETFAHLRPYAQNIRQKIASVNVNMFFIKG